MTDATNTTKIPKIRYGSIAIGFHWVMAILIVGCFCMGLYMSELRLSPQKLKLLSWHKWGGVTVLWLACFRLAWRVSHRPPSLPDTFPRWQRFTAIGFHHFLYMLMFAVPITGWFMSSAKGFPIVYFGIWPLPNVMPKNKFMGEMLEDVHAAFAYMIVIVASGHGLAALKHHFIEKNDILVRMLPFLKIRK